MRNEITQFPEDVGDEHGGGFLNVVAAGMEEGVEGELGTTGEIVALWTPRHFICCLALPGSG